MDKALRNALIAGILIVSASVAYYFVIFLPKKEAIRVDQQNKLEEAKKDCTKRIADIAKKGGGASSSEYKTALDFCLSSKGY